MSVHLFAAVLTSRSTAMTRVQIRRIVVHSGSRRRLRAILFTLVFFAAAVQLSILLHTTTVKFRTFDYTRLHSNTSSWAVASSLLGWLVDAATLESNAAKPAFVFNATANFRFPEFVPDGSTFSAGENLTCFNEGSASQQAVNVTARGCSCRPDWFGVSCSIPGIVERSNKPWTADQLLLRHQPRRVVMAFPFNIEFDMVDLRFAELADVIDVFLILESNNTAYGTPKTAQLLDRLLNGSYEDVRPKIVHVLLDIFPDEGRKDGWIADALHRNYIGTDGLRRIKGLRSDDLFVINDADEIPQRESILFLKWHDGYSEPVALTYRWSVYGFFWGTANDIGGMAIHDLPAVATIGLVVYVFRYKVYGIRNSQQFLGSHDFDVQTYVKMHEGRRRVQLWSIGGLNEPAGWHCSWCLNADGIRTKLVSAQNGDFPRWGDYPEKTNVSYIKQLVARGLWFDGVQAFKRFDAVTGPKFLMRNRVKYRRLLENLYSDELPAPATTVADVVANSTTVTFSHMSIRPGAYRGADPLAHQLNTTAVGVATLNRTNATHNMRILYRTAAVNGLQLGLRRTQPRRR